MKLRERQAEGYQTEGCQEKLTVYPVRRSFLTAIKIPLNRYDRIRDRGPKEKLIEYKNSRIRYAEVVVELENRKPVFMARAFFGF